MNDTATADCSIHFLDAGTIILYLVGMMVVGILCARRNKNAEEYFLARSRMPGWATGFSLMATLISSMSFLATPGFSFKENWRYVPTSFLFVIAGILGIYIFMPVFRRSGINSSYEYLERRFGSWARVYAGISYILMQLARMGLVTYTVSLPIQLLTGLRLEWCIVIVGVVVTVYTSIGGLEAVIWTDMIQGIGLMLGGLLCLPIILGGIPGGFGELVSTAYEDGKMNLGSFDFTLSEITFWVMILPAIFNQLWCVDQTTIQRYIAPKTEREAKKAIITGTLLTIPIWVYFAFIGTALYVFYKFNPTPEINDMAPEQVLPFFILNQMPTGLVGLVTIGILAAAQSSLSSSINAAASITNNDFYCRFFAKGKSDEHYLKASKIFSCIFGGLMIVLALMIYYMRTMTIQDTMNLINAIVTCGIFGLFCVGILTRRVGNLPALLATVLTILSLGTWILLDKLAPELTANMPHKFWIAILGNVMLAGLALLFSYLFGSSQKKDIKGLVLSDCLNPAEENPDNTNEK